jgi:hypothetical protein
MKITRKHMRRIIREELRKTILFEQAEAGAEAAGETEDDLDFTAASDKMRGIHGAIDAAVVALTDIVGGEEADLVDFIQKVRPGGPVMKMAKSLAESRLGNFLLEQVVDWVKILGNTENRDTLMRHGMSIDTAVEGWINAVAPEKFKGGATVEATATKLLVYDKVIDDSTSIPDAIKGKVKALVRSGLGG